MSINAKQSQSTFISILIEVLRFQLIEIEIEKQKVVNILAKFEVEIMSCDYLISRI